MKNPLKNIKGFTLMELLIVVAIIGILSAVGIPMYSGYMATAKVNASKANHANAKSFIAGTFAKCSSGSSSVLLPNYTTVACSNAASTWYGYFTNYFNSYAGFSNAYDGGNYCYNTSSTSPSLGRCHMYYSGNSVRITTNVGTETGGNSYVSDTILKE